MKPMKPINFNGPEWYPGCTSICFFRFLPCCFGSCQGGCQNAHQGLQWHLWNGLSKKSTQKSTVHKIMFAFPAQFLFALAQPLLHVTHRLQTCPHFIGCQRLVLRREAKSLSVSEYGSGWCAYPVLYSWIVYAHTILWFCLFFDSFICGCHYARPMPAILCYAKP